MHFEWDEQKNHLNQEKHKISFQDATKAFLDKKRVIAKDVLHSNGEKRFFCFGKRKNKVLTVRFTFRNNKIRIFGAGFWREGVRKYEKQTNKI